MTRPWHLPTSNSRFPISDTADFVTACQTEWSASFLRAGPSGSMSKLSRRAIRIRRLLDEVHATAHRLGKKPRPGKTIFFGLQRLCGALMRECWRRRWRSSEAIATAEMLLDSAFVAGPLPQKGIFGYDPSSRRRQRF
jgi:hypothetical protein